ncbi:MAG: FkbM family methyltransferase [Bacteroidetes bacterium]|nr:FkbM family methyltransferase [Bacteroidota bacterium]
MFSTILKKSLRVILKQKGYHICKISTLESDIQAGKYAWLQDMGIRTVLDVGANVGKFTTMISEILSNVNIYAFEPLADCYKELIENTKHLDNINYFNFALGEKESETIIYRNEFSPSSSILKMKELHKKSFPKTMHSFNEVIQIRDLDGVNDEINWIQKTLMKIDVQGFELNMLKGAISSLNNIDVIIVETSFVELYENQPLFDDIYSFLVKRNFSYQGNFDQLKDPNSSCILQADAIFTRN